MHDTEHALEKPHNTYRILILGDSFVQAVHVAEADTSHQVLEDNLNAQANGLPNFEVISSGVIAWGTNQQLVFYRETGKLFDPDLVLLMFSMSSDFQDNLPGQALTTQSINSYSPYFSICDGELNPTPLIYAPGISTIENKCSPVERAIVNALGKLHQNSMLYQKLERAVLSKQPRQIFGQNYPSPFSALYLPLEEPELEQAWDVTLGTIAQLQQEVEADGRQFAVALVTPGVVVRLMLLSSAEKEQFFQDNPVFANVEADRPNQRLAQFLAEQNIPFIDLTQPTVEYWANNGIPLYFIDNGHWTVEGNRVTADILTGWLVESGLLEDSGN
jgi:lysophospholipase L1-like esterase